VRPGFSMRASTTRRFSPVLSILLCAGVAAGACAGPKFTPDAECDSCEGGAGGVEDRAGRGGVESGGTGGTGPAGTGNAGKGGSAARGGSSGASAGTSSGEGGAGGGLGGLAGAGGSVAGASGAPPAGGTAGVTAGGAGVGGASGTEGGGSGGSGGADPVGFPLTDVLDDFEKPELFPENWEGSVDDFTVAEGVLTCNNCPHAALHSDELDADQEAFVTLTSFETDAAEINLILLAQNEICDLIEVLYSPLRQVLEVHTCYVGVWEAHGATEATLAAGDRFGARLHADGTVQVFVNDVEQLSVELGPLANDDGQIGVSGNTTAPIVFDDFGGGAWR
jgi:hypothetical protein